MTMSVPFGGLVSFGPFSFSGPSTPLSSFNIEWIETFVPLTMHKYPHDVYGLSEAPQKDPKATWKYLIMATPGLTGTAAYQNVQDQYNAFLAALNTTYTFTGTVMGQSVSGATVSGNVGNLVVHDANGTTHRTAWARINKVACALLPAQNTYAYEVEITWEILEDWA